MNKLDEEFACLRTREEAHEFLMRNVAMYRVFHSPRVIWWCILSGIALALAICWLLSLFVPGAELQ